MDNIKENGTEIEYPFEQKEEKKGEALTREELEKKTGRQLAALAKPKSKFALSTLEGFGKSRLINIILGIEKQEDNKKTQDGRAPQNESESESIINMGLTVAHAFKQKREGETAQLNPIALELFTSSAVAHVDKARAEGVLKADKFQTALFAGSGLLLAVDAFIGFDNVPKVFSKITSKLRPKPKE